MLNQPGLSRGSLDDRLNVELSRKNQTSLDDVKFLSCAFHLSREAVDPVFDSCEHPIPYFLRVDPEFYLSLDACRRTGTRLGKQSDETLKIIVSRTFVGSHDEHFRNRRSHAYNFPNNVSFGNET